MSENENIELYLYGKDHVDHLILPALAEGQRWLKGIDQNGKTTNLMAIVARKGVWHLVQNENCVIENEKDSYVVVHVALRCIIVTKTDRFLLLSTPYTKKAHAFLAYQARKKRIVIGRDQACDIVCTQETISARHACLYQLDATRWCIEDLQSANGVYVNGVRCFKRELQVMDHIQIMELAIVKGVDGFFMNQVDAIAKQVALDPIRTKQTRVENVSFIGNMEPMALYCDTFQHTTFVVDSPPPPQQKKDTPLMLLIGPALTMGFSSMFMGVFSIFQSWMGERSLLQSIPTLIMSLSMALGAILWPLLARRYEKKEILRHEHIRQQAYMEYLSDMQQAIQHEIHAYTSYLKETFYDSTSCIQYAMENKAPSVHEQHPAYLQLVLGYGNYAYAPAFDGQQEGFVLHKDPLSIQRLEMLYHPYTLVDVPRMLSLSNCDIVSVTGIQAQTYLLDIVFQIVLRHSPSDVALIIAISRNDAYANGIAWLPHIFSMDGAHRYLICDENECYNVHKILEQEKRFLIYVSFFELRDEKMYWMRKRREMVFVTIRSQKRMMRSSREYGISLGQSDGQLEQDHSTIHFEFQQSNQETRRICAQRIIGYYQRNIPSQLQMDHAHFLDMYACANIRQLNIWDRWNKSDVSQSLAVCIGFHQREVLQLDAHEKGHGPHGLFAGMTGSGKSECLLTYILALCVAFSPHDVSFLLIDYKGGTMASSCAKLPHVAGIITNLQDDMLQRSFLSLEAELKRRQMVLNKAAQQYDIGNMNIDKYHILCKEHPALPKLSHLFIIADEFAELKMQEPACMDQLKQSARIGRSLGIHLLLATQKPAGVIDDQIWSNANFHLCMKVQSTQDSHDMLKKDDAAYLKKAGECYLQVGMDEVYERGQVAWSQSPYIEQDEYTPFCFDEIQLLHANAQPYMTRHMRPKADNVSITQMEATIRYISHLAKQHNQYAQPLWKAQLLAHIPQASYKDAVLYMDDMLHQKQYPLSYKQLPKHHTILYGDEASSKSMYIRTMLCVSLQHIPKGRRTYIFDFADHRLALFKTHGDIVDVLHEQDQEKVALFFYQMKKELQQRKQSANRSALLVIVHGYEQFCEHYEGFVDDLILLLREGEALGIQLILTAVKPDGISYRLTQYVHSYITFYLHDKTEYQRIYQGAWCPIPSAHLGSGIMKVQEDIVLFQTLEVQDEQIASLPDRAPWLASYPLPVLPTIIKHAIADSPLYIGMDMVSKENVSLSLRAHLYYFCASFQLPKPFLQLLCKQALHSFQNAYIVTKDCIYTQEITLTPSQFYHQLCEAKPMVIIWNQPYDNEDPRIKEYCMKHMMEDLHTHCMLFTMKEQGYYMSYPWFQEGMYDAVILWMGRGMSEHRYLFKNEAIPTKELKKSQAYLIEEDTCRQLQLWEEERHG